jgi:integrase/recombinase XerD
VRYILILNKIQLFISAKKLEGLSSITLDNNLMELSMFAETVKKKAEYIATADIRIFKSRWDLKNEHN